MRILRSLLVTSFFLAACEEVPADVQVESTESALSMAFNYTRAELDAASRTDLVDLILDYQAARGGSTRTCTPYDLSSGDQPQILVRVNNRGYTNDGTLQWPDGTTFMLRNSGYTNDRTLYYPDGTTFYLRNSGYTNDRNVSWPTGNTLYLRNSGYTNDRSIFRADGSNWLIRNQGFSNDRQRVGGPTASSIHPTFTVNARLTPSDGVILTTKLEGMGWEIQVGYDADQDQMTVTECFD